MKLLIITSGKSGHAIRRLTEESKRLNINVFVIKYEQLVYKFIENDLNITDRMSGTSILDYDLIILRSVKKEKLSLNYHRGIVADFLKERAPQIPVLNRDHYLEYHGLAGKFHQQYGFYKYNIPSIETRVFGGLKSYLSAKYDYPFVIKSSFGSGGNDVYKVENEDDEQILDEYSPRDMVVQPLLDIKYDIRVNVIGTKVLGAMKREKNHDGFLTNFSAGGKVSEISLTDEMKDLSLKVCSSFSLEYAGVDLVGKAGDLRVLEFNDTATFKGFETSNSINVAKEILNYLLEQTT